MKTINKNLKEIHIFTDLSDMEQVSDWDLETMCTDYKETDTILYGNADVSILKTTQIYLLVDAFFFNFKGIKVILHNNGKEIEIKEGTPLSGNNGKIEKGDDLIIMFLNNLLD